MGAMALHGDGLVIQARWVGVDGIRVHCLTAGGAGSPVVLLHGGGIDSASFTYGHIIGPLATGAHRFLAPDWPGYGQSDNPNLDYTMDFYVGFLGRLLDALGLERASLVGISMDSYGLGSGVPWGRLGYLMVRVPFVDKLTYALLR
jgi:pimeloyl-ACP methyl ester carboxylesterase